MVIFYKKSKKYNEIQLTINILDLNNRKLANHPLSPYTAINAGAAVIYTQPEVNCTHVPTAMEYAPSPL